MLKSTRFNDKKIARTNIVEKPSLICFSHLRWNFVFQRPQHLLTRAAKTYHVLFIEEPVFENDVAAHIKLSFDDSGVTVATPVLPHGLSGDDITAIQKKLVNNLLAGRSNEKTVVWYYSPMALSFSAHVSSDVCIYDCMDELANFKGAPESLKEQERRLFTKANLVFTGGRSLYEAKAPIHSDVYCFPSSIDASHFSKARKQGMSDPADQAEITHPRLGFFGVVDERMDLDLVEACAKARPDWQFVMIGPVVKIDPASLPNLPNIHWLGQKSYKELPSYLSGWDIGFMPFALNESTRFISPTKTPEFLAAGLPVISTAITDVVRHYGEEGIVEIASDANDVVMKAQKYVDDQVDDVWLKKVDKVLSTSSWDKTWANMNALIEEVLYPVDYQEITLNNEPTKAMRKILNGAARSTTMTESVHV